MSSAFHYKGGLASNQAILESHKSKCRFKIAGYRTSQDNSIRSLLRSYYISYYVNYQSKILTKHEKIGSFCPYFGCSDSINPENHRIFMAELEPIRSHPASIKASIASLVRIPPAALIFTSGPMYFLNSSISSRAAPALPKPVEVLI